MITHSVWSLGAGDHYSPTRSPCLSPDALLRRLASLSRGLWPRSLCLVRVSYIRTRTSPSRSRAPRFLSLVSGRRSLSRQRSAVPLWSAVSGLSLSHQRSLSHLVARLSLSLSRRATRLVSSLSPLLSRLLSVAGQPAFTCIYSTQ